MAKPEELPDSVILGQFEGIRNNVAPERLLSSDLEKAINVDIDDSGQLRRRRGRTLVSAGSFHSVFEYKDRVYGVKNNTLGIIRPDYSFYSLASASIDPISYAPVGDQIYYSSRSTNGIINGEAASPWGAVVDGTWISPVIAPTDTLGAISGKLVGPVPTATSIAAYKGRIYAARDNIIWATELYLYNYIDKTKNFMQLEHDVTLMVAQENGIAVGTTGGLYYLQGTFGKMQISQITSTPVLPGSAVIVPNELVHPNARQGPVPTGDAVVMMTEAGILACFDNGSCYNLTEKKMNFPRATSAAALFRQQDGVNTIVVVADSGGTPIANARIGDYVDAEIVRFQGG